MKTDFTDLMAAVKFKDDVNAWKGSDKLSKEELIKLIEGEVEELKQAVENNERKANQLLEIADIVVFCGILYNKIMKEERK